MTKRCLIMAGGTGGHVFPGIAVADTLVKRGWHIDWLGTAERMEAQVVPQHGYPIHFIPVKGLRGKGIQARLSGVWALFKSLIAARKLVRTLQPDVVLGMGGYASGPGGLAAWLANSVSSAWSVSEKALSWSESTLITPQMEPLTSSGTANSERV